MKKKPFYTFIKRFFDILCSFLAIIVLSPFLLIVSIVVKCSSKGPVLFKQERYGKNKKPFKLWKFRSMYTNTDPNLPTFKLKNPDQHITKVGKFLRKTSIDELPQLFNIFVGKMSFVGPRPVILNEFELINKRDNYHANDIRPGLTGLAQISGRDHVDEETKARLDGEYVAKRGLFFDLMLILKTVVKVFKQEDIVEGEDAKNKKAPNQENIEVKKLDQEQEEEKTKEAVGMK